MGAQHPKEHICSECGKAYRRADALKEHQRIVHAETVLRCQHEGCGQIFASASGLRNHERVFHRGLRPFTCRQCGQTFAYRHVLNRHIQTHTVMRPTSGQDEVPPETAPRRNAVPKRPQVPGEGAQAIPGTAAVPASIGAATEAKCAPKRGVKRAVRSAAAQLPRKRVALARPAVAVTTAPAPAEVQHKDEDLATEVTRIMNMAIMAPNNWRGTLGLNDTDDAVKSAPTLYRHLMKILHPDKRTAHGEMLAGGSERCNAALDRVQVALEMVKIAPAPVALPVHCERSGTMRLWGVPLPRARVSMKPEKAKHPLRSRVSDVSGASNHGYDARRCQRRPGLGSQGSIHEHRPR